ncbi:hypothetical protein AB9Q10_26535 [Streptomyces krungchingensis]
MTNDVDTLATALYVTTDDMLKEHPDLAPWRSSVGITPRLSDGFQPELSEHGVQLLRAARKGEREWPGAVLFKPLRQVIESINETFK